MLKTGKHPTDYGLHGNGICISIEPKSYFHANNFDVEI